MRMETDEYRIAVFEMLAYPFYLVRIHVWRRDLHRVGKVQNHLFLRSRLPHVHYGLRDFPGKLDLGRAEALRRVLKHELRSLEHWNSLANQLGASNRNTQNLIPGHAENDAALRGRGGVVKMHDRALCA